MDHTSCLVSGTKMFLQQDMLQNKKTKLINIEMESMSLLDCLGGGGGGGGGERERERDQ